MENFIYPDRILEEMQTSSALKNRKIYLNEVVDNSSIFKVIYFINRILKNDELEGKAISKREPIEIVINSPGGSCYDGLALISKIESLKKMGYKIITSCDSIAMSMGASILLIGSERRALKHSRIMIHPVSSGTYGQIQTMLEDLEEAKAIWNRMKDIIINNTKITNEQLEDITRRKYDWYFWSEEALELGIIDIID